jgi:prepilin-type N-terminal cleavage/methylation domain-containing protein
MLRTRKPGFTLIELIIVCLIIGILAGFAVPQYLKSIETGKADSASSVLKMIATSNRMYAMDNSGTYTSGTFDDTCNNTGLTCPVAAGTADRCNLVACKYLGAQEWGAAGCAGSQCPSYSFAAVANAAACPHASIGGSANGMVACAWRNGGSSPYSGWGYSIDVTGVVTCTPSPCGNSGNPPIPSQ